MTIEVTSDYMPGQLVHGSFAWSIDMILCPYCLTPLAPGTINCPSCLQDTSNDAPIEMDAEQYASALRKQCSACGATMLELAVTCPVCRKRQGSP